MDANLIESLEDESLYGLQNLEYLYLDANKLTQVPVESLRRTPKLRVL